KGGTAARRHDDERGCRLERGEDLGLERPEPRHAVLGDHLRAGLPGLALDLVVEIHGPAAESLREERRDRRLADARRADEEEVHQRSAIGFRRSRYRATALVMSSIVSSPNFRQSASARTNASIASATTPAAGMMQT